MRWTVTQTRRALRAGVPAGRVREMETDCTREEYLAEVKAATALLVSVPLADGSDVLVSPSLVGAVRGIDGDGDVVIKGWTGPDGEYLVALTPCCLASSSIDESGSSYCKGCYGHADSKYGCEADLAVGLAVTCCSGFQRGGAECACPAAHPASTDAEATPPPAADAPAPAPQKEKRMTRTKATPAAEQFTSLGLTDPADWTPAMNLAVKQKWSGLPIDTKVDDLRAELAAVAVEATPTAAMLEGSAMPQHGDTREMTAVEAEVEAHRLARNAKVNAWRRRNQIQAALDARALKFAAMRAKKVA